MDDSSKLRQKIVELGKVVSCDTLIQFFKSLGYTVAFKKTHLRPSIHDLPELIGFHLMFYLNGKYLGDYNPNYIQINVEPDNLHLSLAGLSYPVIDIYGATKHNINVEHFFGSDLKNELLQDIRLL